MGPASDLGTARRAAELIRRKLLAPATARRARQRREPAILHRVANDWPRIQKSERPPRPSRPDRRNRPVSQSARTADLVGNRPNADPRRGRRPARQGFRHRRPERLSQPPAARLLLRRGTQRVLHGRQGRRVLSRPVETPARQLPGGVGQRRQSQRRRHSRVPETEPSVATGDAAALGPRSQSGRNRVVLAGNWPITPPTTFRSLTTPSWIE